MDARLRASSLLIALPALLVVSGCMGGFRVAATPAPAPQPHVPDAARERARLYRSPYRGVRRRLGSVDGNSFHVRYTMGKPAVRMEQWMFLQPDGRSVLNRATVTVLGIPVARLSETIRR